MSLLLGAAALGLAATVARARAVAPRMDLEPSASRPLDDDGYDDAFGGGATDDDYLSPRA